MIFGLGLDQSKIDYIFQSIFNTSVMVLVYLLSNR